MQGVKSGKQNPREKRLAAQVDELIDKGEITRAAIYAWCRRDALMIGQAPATEADDAA